mgnify:CR=1 FL=1
MQTLRVTPEQSDGRMYGVVRDKDGNLRIDGNPADLHPGIVMLLTPQERANLGIWDGPQVRDAQGVKRVSKDSEHFVAEDALVAAGEISVVVHRFRLLQRADFPVRLTFPLQEA